MRFSNRSNTARLGVFRQERQRLSCHCEPFAGITGSSRVSLRTEGETIYTNLAVFSVARFGAWVVCIYRTWAMQSLSVINCSDLRPFFFQRKSPVQEQIVLSVNSLNKSAMCILWFCVICLTPSAFIALLRIVQRAI